MAGKKNMQVTQMQAAPKPPKKPLSAFFQFRKKYYQDVKRDNPDDKITVLTKKIGEMWNAASEEEKEKCVQLYHQDKVKYTKEMEAYERKYGNDKKERESRTTSKSVPKKKTISRRK